MNSKADEYFSKLKKWNEELFYLRQLLLECGLTEEFKWRVPCYTFNTTNVVIINGFKESCVLSFLKGALLNNADDVLQKPGENSQSARIIKFISLDAILRLAPTIKAYVYEAIEIEKLGLKVDFKEKTELVFPDELHSVIDANPVFKTAFYALTPGRQRAYNLHFSAPKQAQTRALRIEKCITQILNGKGLNDCTCGLSKRMPACDGSHKILTI
jgi:uncharacterized protein YdeI (YjbR/CyaY-like superfamily)